METVLYIFATLVGLIIDVVSLAMMVRMLLPIFVDIEESKIYYFLLLITEPFIIPVRFILVKMNWLQDSPIDWSFFISYIVMALVRMILPII